MVWFPTISGYLQRIFITCFTHYIYQKITSLGQKTRIFRGLISYYGKSEYLHRIFMTDWPGWSRLICLRKWNFGIKVHNLGRCYPLQLKWSDLPSLPLCWLPCLIRNEMLAAVVCILCSYPLFPGYDEKFVTLESV